jgi:hypothetical protein
MVPISINFVAKLHGKFIADLFERDFARVSAVIAAEA